MKTFSVVSFLTLFAVQSKSQINIEGIEIIRHIIEQKQDTNKVYYSDSMLRNYRYQEMINLLRKRQFTSYLKPKVKTSITLTKWEQKHILDQLKIINQTVWPDSIFSNCQKYPSDSTWDILRHLQSRRRPKNFKEVSKVWEFMRPILFRDNTCALIYSQYLCGGECGMNEIAFYRKENEIWIKWVRVSAGEF